MPSWRKLQALEKKARDTFLQFQKDDIAKLEETLQEAKEAAEPDATRPEAQQLQERMQALAAELEFGALSQEEYDRMFACREELQQVRADIAAIEKATPASGDLDSQLKAARAEIDQCKLKLQYLAQYISKRAEMTFSALKMNRVEISLYDVVKSTGEVKDTFKFTYNGRRYDWLSLSEKIRAGMEVSELMKRLTGRNYPQFVDNMESVDDLANVRPTGQVIMAKCVSKAELSVRPVKPILSAHAYRRISGTGRRCALWLVPMKKSPSWTRPDGAGLSLTPRRFGVGRSRQAAPSAVTTVRGNII